MGSFLGMETLSLSWLARYLIPWNGNSLALVVRSLSHSLEWKLSRSPGSLVISFLGIETLLLSWLARYLIPWNGNSLALLARSLSHSLEWKLSLSLSLSLNQIIYINISIKKRTIHGLV